MSELDARALARWSPAAPDRAADTSLTTVGTVLGVDPPAGLVLVSVHQSTGSWVPAVAGRYVVGGPCRVLLDPWSGGRTVTVLGPVAPTSPVVLGTLTVLNPVTNRAAVTVAGTGYTVPFIPSTYTTGAEAWVALDDWGTPVLVLGPSDDPPPPPAPPTPGPGPAPAPGPTTVQAETVVLPQWSGSYRHNRSAWDRWNTGTYGGRSTLYQGSGYGSGPMTGLATYGDQLVNLGATAIDRVVVVLRGVALSGASGPATVQGSPHGSQPTGAPAAGGETATGDGGVDLPASIREDMRTGATRALALVGGNYWAVAGAGNGDGMALVVTYTRPA